VQTRILIAIISLATFLTGCMSTSRQQIPTPTPTPTPVPVSIENALVTNVGAPTAIAFTPDGRLLITSLQGPLRVFQNGNLLATPALDLTSITCSNGERGLLGIAVDPDFASNNFIYLYYTFNKFNTCPTGQPTNALNPVNRVSRFILGSDNRVIPGSEIVLIDNILSPNGNHNGGDLQFGKDGFLYISVGDGGADYAGDSGAGGDNDAARDRNILLGKILRITRDGDIPPTNPFFQSLNSARCNITGRTTPANFCQETFAMGLRNPFRIAFDPNAAVTRFFINDVGQGTWEEISEGRSAADYGWNIREGPCVTNSTTNCGPPPAGLTDPLFAYQHTSGCSASGVRGNSISGGAFVPNGVWPSQFNGAYLFGEFVCGKIFQLRPNGSVFAASEFATGPDIGNIVTMIFGPHQGTQALYYTTFAGGGQVRRISVT
jgi:glucose/arabinose dehydrogenase